MSRWSRSPAQGNQPSITGSATSLNLGQGHIGLLFVLQSSRALVLSQVRARIHNLDAKYG